MVASLDHVWLCDELSLDGIRNDFLKYCQDGHCGVVVLNDGVVVYCERCKVEELAKWQNDFCRLLPRQGITLGHAGWIGARMNPRRKRASGAGQNRIRWFCVSADTKNVPQILHTGHQVRVAGGRYIVARNVWLQKYLNTAGNAEVPRRSCFVVGKKGPPVMKNNKFHRRSARARPSPRWRIQG